MREEAGEVERPLRVPAAEAVPAALVAWMVPERMGRELAREPVQALRGSGRGLEPVPESQRDGQRGERPEPPVAVRSA